MLVLRDREAEAHSRPILRIHVVRVAYVGQDILVLGECLEREVYVIVVLLYHFHVARLVHVLLDVLLRAKTNINLLEE